MTVDKTNRITQLDYANCINIIQKEVREVGMEAVCCSPFLFVYDNKVQREFLPGEVSEKLTVKADCLLLDSVEVRRYRKIFNDLDIFPYLELVDVYAALSFLMGGKIPERFLFLSLGEDEYVLSLVEEGRLLFAENLERGLRDDVHDLAKSLSADDREARTFVDLFGFSSGKGLINPLPHVLSQEEGREKIEKVFKPLLDAIDDLCHRLNLEGNIPLALFGPGTEIPDIDFFLLEKTKRKAYIVDNNTIGARSQDFIPTLGAIKASSLPYQLSSHEGIRQAEDEAIKKTYFGRN